MARLSSGAVGQALLGARSAQVNILCASHADLKHSPRVLNVILSWHDCVDTYKRLNHTRLLKRQRNRGIGYVVCLDN